MFVVLFDIERFFRVCLPSGLQEVRYVQRFFMVLFDPGPRTTFLLTFWERFFTVFYVSRERFVKVFLCLDEAFIGVVLEFLY